MNRTVRSSLAVLALLLTAAPGAAVIGLGARFGDVIIENVQPGRVYNLREAASVPFVVENKGDEEVEVEVRFSRPERGALAKEFEAVPDPGWLKAVPAKVRIGAHGLGYFDLLLSVPEEAGLKGRNFQVTATAAMVGTGLFNVGIDNRIRFSVGPGPESLRSEKKKKAMQQLDFDVTPSEIYLREVPVGAKFDARKEARKSIRVANYAAERLEVLLSPEKWDARFPVPEGYEPIPDPGWIRMAKSTVTVAPDAIGSADFSVTVPPGEEWKGRKFAAMIRTGLTTGFWLDAPVKLLVETRR